MKNSEIVLVTGGTSAVDVNCVLQLLQKGYIVRTTLRNLCKRNDVLTMLKAGGITTSEDNLTFVQADLSSDANWETAINGCTYVLHVASPTHVGSEDESEMTGHAVNGVLRVLKVARDQVVKCVVLTSSYGALGFSKRIVEFK